MVFVVIESTPGYMPENDDPFVTDDYEMAVEHANDLAAELEEQGYVIDRREGKIMERIRELRAQVKETYERGVYTPEHALNELASLAEEVRDEDLLAIYCQLPSDQTVAPDLGRYITVTRTFEEDE